MFDRKDAVKTAAAILSEARNQRPGAADKLIVITFRHQILPDEIGSTKEEIKKFARSAIIERILTLIAAVGAFRRNFDSLAAAADFSSSQHSIVERFKRSGPTDTLMNEAREYRIIE